MGTNTIEPDSDILLMMMNDRCLDQMVHAAVIRAIRETNRYRITHPKYKIAWVYSHACQAEIMYANSETLGRFSLAGQNNVNID